MCINTLPPTHPPPHPHTHTHLELPLLGDGEKPPVGGKGQVPDPLPLLEAHAAEDDLPEQVDEEEVAVGVDGEEEAAVGAHGEATDGVRVLVGEGAAGVPHQVEGGDAGGVGL